MKRGDFYLWPVILLTGFFLIATAKPATAESADIANAKGNFSDQRWGDFLVLASSPVGQALFLKLPAASSLDNALQQTLISLARASGGQPTLVGAYGNAKSKRSGGALVTLTLRGQPYRAWIFTGMNGPSATSTVVLAANTASTKEISTLFSSLPAPVKLTRHAFPDGSGSVDLPAGWTTPNQSLSFGFVAQGPGGQAVTFGDWRQINTPHCLIVRQAENNYQTALTLYNRQMDKYRRDLQAWQTHPNRIHPLLPAAPQRFNLAATYPALTFCPYCPTVQEVIKTYYPIIAEKARSRGAPFTTIDRVIALVPTAADPNPLIPNFSAGIAYLEVTDHIGGAGNHVRTLVRVETYPYGDGSDRWAVCLNAMRAPDSTFDHDIPTMIDIMNSIQMNISVVNAAITTAGETVRQYGQMRFDSMMQAGRDFNDQQASRFRSFQQQQAAQSQARNDSASDMIELIRGVRDVYDSKEGIMYSVDLFRVNDVTNAANEASFDPDRFVQIPLRYERR